MQRGKGFDGLRRGWLWVSGISLSAAAGVALISVPSASTAEEPAAVRSAQRPAAAAVALAQKKEAESSAKDAIPDSPDYGHLTGQFVFKGTVPTPGLILAKGDAKARDSAVCAAHDIYKEDLVVDPETKGIAHIFVYMKKAPAIHPELKKSPEPTVTFDQRGCVFLPHSLIVRTDQTVMVLSDDPIAHNTRTNPLRNTAKSVVISPSDRKGVPYTFKNPESLPIEIKCDYHPWMTARWLILDHPYAAVTDKEGRFEIKHLPPGKHEFTVWQERAGYVERKLDVTIKGGETTDLGTVEVDASKFK